MPTFASVKRRIPTRSSSQKAQQRQEKPSVSAVPKAPDLRRLSDFVNPFPHVGFGGYTKYYQGQQSDFPEIWSLNNMPPPQKQPQQHPPRLPPPPQPSRGTRTSTRDSASCFARPGQSRNRRLSDIPESPSEALTPSPSSNQLRATPSTSSGQPKTLRRTERRVIRTASVASTKSSTASRSASSTTLDRAQSTSSSSHSVMTSTTSSSTTNVSSYFDRAASTESHSTSPTDESESVLTPTDEQSLDAHYHVAHKEKIPPVPPVPVAVPRPRIGQRAPQPTHLRPPRRPMKTYVPPSDESDFDTDDDSDDDPVDWRATFYTAKSSLSDM